MYLYSQILNKTAGDGTFVVERNAKQNKGGFP
jgi:hypothetical protein